MKWRLLLRRFLLERKYLWQNYTAWRVIQKRTCETWRLVQIFFTLLWWIETIHINYISRYSYLNISCCNITFFSRISQLYKQSHFKAAHCSNECELHSKQCLIHSDLKKREWNSDLDYNKLLLNWMWTCQTTMSVCSSDTYTVDLKGWL
jgi:hypothetical protein